MNRAITSSSSTVLGVGCLFLLLILAPSAPSSSNCGFVEAVEFTTADNAVVGDTEQIISIQYSTRTMMEEDVDGGDSDFNLLLLIMPLLEIPNKSFPSNIL